ncbi:MAG: putative Ig domain-containing protein [Pseudomonadota bacterium]
MAGILLLAGAGCEDGAGGADDVADGDESSDAGDVADGAESNDTGDAPDADSSADETAPITITTEALLDGRVQIAYWAQIEVADAAGEASWEVSDGALPPGLMLGPDGTISGLPERSGVYEFEITADDGSSSDTAGLSIRVARVLLMSGFEPFGEFEINSSWEAIEPLDGMIVEGLDVRVVELAVVWGDSWDELAREIDRLHPDVVIATGQAGLEGMRFETYASNRMNGTDEAGVTMRNAPIVEGAPDRLEARYPVYQMRDAMDWGGFPVLISSNAGEYLCNFVMYQLLYDCINTMDGPVACGFIHVPPVPYEGAMTVDEINEAHLLGIGALAAWLESREETQIAVPDFHEPPRYFF